MIEIFLPCDSNLLQCVQKGPKKLCVIMSNSGYVTQFDEWTMCALAMW